MKGKAKKLSKFMRVIRAPVRILAKAKDFYMNNLFDCAGKLGPGGVVGGYVAPQVPQLPRSFSVVASKNISNHEDLNEILRLASARNGAAAVVEIDGNGKILSKKEVTIRSYSVGLGRIGRIDEDQPCDFKEADIARNNYPRCRTYAIGRSSINLR